MTYRVFFRKQIHGSFSSCSSADVWVYRLVELPFAPFQGLEVADGDWDAVVQSVCYEIDKAKIVAFTEEDKEIYDAQLRRVPHRTVQEIAREYTDAGWFIEE